MAEFDAADVLQGIAELYDPLAEEKGLALGPRSKARCRCAATASS